MPNLTVSSNVDTMLAAADNAAIRTAIGLGTTANPTFANLALTSSSLSADAPVTISQTWNNAAVAFTGLKVNAVSTDSLTTSRLLDLQAGGASKFSVDRTGNIYVDSTNSTAYLAFRVGTNTAFEYYGGSGWGDQPFSIRARAGLNIDSNIGRHQLLFAGDTILLRDGAPNTLALRNAGATQTFRVYRSYLNAGVDYERLSFSHDGVQFAIGTERAGSGVAQPLRIFGGSSAALDFATGVTFRNASGGTAYMTLGSTGITFGADNTYDIGASGANRPRNLFIGGSADVAGTFACPTIYTGPTGNATALTTPTNGVFRITNNSATDFNRLQFGGGTSSFPAIKRVGAEFQIVKADTAAASNVAAADADMTFIEDRYRRKGTGTPEAAVTAPIGAVFHRTDGGAGTSFYVKESGTGNTGWVGK